MPRKMWEVGVEGDRFNIHDENEMCEKSGCVLAFDFHRDAGGSPLSFEEAVFQALGAASMCWSETPKGIFDSTRAKEIGDKLLEEYHAHGPIY